MFNYKSHLISTNMPVREALTRLNDLAPDAILFAIDDEEVLVGSLTDGDIRRGFIKGLTMESRLSEFVEREPKCLIKGSYGLAEVKHLRDQDLQIIPVVDPNRRIINVINFRIHKSYLPVDAVIMAGGRGERLRPNTDTTPKPLLLVGEKPILEHNIDRLSTFGVDDFWLSIRYLGELIENYFGDGSNKNVQIKYIKEDEPLGTIGAISQVIDFQHDYILVTNSDILTNLNYEDFYDFFISSDSDLSVVTVPYIVDIPYAVLDTNGDNEILSFMEKPTYTYYSNGGIYLMKKEVLNLIPSSKFFNATDLMELMIEQKMKITSFPMVGYWLDIGKHEDYKKANRDISHIQFK